jgi:hypothetical protein
MWLQCLCPSFSVFWILLICFTSFGILESDLWRQSEKYVDLLYLEGFLLSSDLFLYEFWNHKIKLIEFIFKFGARGYKLTKLRRWHKKNQFLSLLNMLNFSPTLWEKRNYQTISNICNFMWQLFVWAVFQTVVIWIRIFVVKGLDFLPPFTFSTLTNN